MTNLGKALSAYQQKYDVEGKGLAKKLGVAESTLTRLKQGKMPDARALARIVVWLAEDCHV